MIATLSNLECQKNSTEWCEFESVFTSTYISPVWNVCWEFVPR
jgi:hypothetical protein